MPVHLPARLYSSVATPSFNCRFRTRSSDDGSGSGLWRDELTFVRRAMEHVGDQRCRRRRTSCRSKVMAPLTSSVRESHSPLGYNEHERVPFTVATRQPRMPRHRSRQSRSNFSRGARASLVGRSPPLVMVAFAVGQWPRRPGTQKPAAQVTSRMYRRNYLGLSEDCRDTNTKYIYSYTLYT